MSARQKPKDVQVRTQIHVDSLPGFEQSHLHVEFHQKVIESFFFLGGGNLNTLPDEDLYSMSSWESSFMARPVAWVVGIRTSGDSHRWHSLLLTSFTQSPPQMSQTWPTLSCPTVSRCRWNCEHQECR